MAEETINRNMLQIVLAAAVTMLIVAWGSYNYIYAPKLRDIKKLQGDLRILDQEIITIAGKNVDSNKIEETKESLRIELAELSKKIPTEKETPYLIDSFINQVGKGLRIDFKLIQPMGLISENKYKRVPIRIEFESSYYSFNRYLEQLKSLPAIIRIDKLDLFKSPKYDNVAVKMDLSAFVMPGGVLPPQAKEAVDLTELEDPFFPKVVKIEINVVQRTTTLSGLSYSGFFGGKELRAIINDVPLSEGESISGFTVTKIYRDRVILKKAGKLYTLWIK